MPEPLRVPKKDSEYLAKRGRKSRSGTPLQYEGDEVKSLQEALLALGYELPEHGSDGLFVDETDAAVRNFQGDRKDLFESRDGKNVPLRKDGIVGPKTSLALNCALARAGIWFNEYEYEWTDKEGKDYRVHCTGGTKISIKQPAKGEIVRLHVSHAPLPNWDSGKKYYEDLRPIANLKKGSVDDHGAKRGPKQNTFNNYVYDLQNHLRRFGFVEVGMADGIFGRRTKQAVEEFQAETYFYPEKSPDRVEMTASVGPKTKRAIRRWLKDKHKRPGTFYEFRLIPQPTKHSCWAAATSILLASPRAAAPSPPLRTYPKPAKVASKMGYSLNTTLSYTDVGKLANAYGLKVYSGNLSAQTLSNLLQNHGPLWIGKPESLTDNFDHAVVVVGVHDRGNVLIADPFPVKRGKIRLESTDGFISYFQSSSKSRIVHRPKKK